MSRRKKYLPIRSLAQTLERILKNAREGIGMEKLHAQFAKKYPDETPDRFLDAVNMVVQKGEYTVDAERNKVIRKPYRGVVIFRPGFAPMVKIDGNTGEKVPLGSEWKARVLPGDVVEGYRALDYSDDESCDVFHITRFIFKPMEEVVGEVRWKNRKGREVRTLIVKRLENFNFRFSNPDTAKKLDGKFVTAKILERPKKAGEPFVVEVLGVLKDQSGIGVEIQEALRVFNLPYRFSKQTREEVARVPAEVQPEDLEGREDLSDLDFCTIDGEDARDFDDAVYAKKEGRDYRLVVAIADVSHYVRPKSGIDADAQLRSTSVYFPRNVIPMLPEELSNGICSLNPRVRRLVFACDMRIAPNGGILSYRFYKASIISKARLTYTQVFDALFADVKRPVLGMMRRLQALKRVYEILRQAREKRHALDFDSSEPKFVFDEKNEVCGVIQSAATDANRLIEECMLAANVCAATFIEKSGRPSLYRVHPEPSEEKKAALSEALASFGLTLPYGKSDMASLAKVLQSVKDKPIAPAVQMLVLRSMMRAKYSPENVGHFGLQYPLYTHFTSPIRRYPDLLVHRTIAAILEKKTYVPHIYEESLTILESVQGRGLAQENRSGKNEHGTKDRQNKKGDNNSPWAVLGAITSAAERRAEEAERDIDKWLKCLYLERLLKTQNVFKGRISTVTPFGFFVELEDIGLDGLVHISEIGNDYYEYCGSYIVGQNLGKRFEIGQEVKVSVTDLSVEDRSVDFCLVDSKGRRLKSRVAGWSRKLTADDREQYE